MEERIQKILSRAGIGSRRACEELILAGQVLVNGRRAEIGQKADLAVDRITLNGRLIKATEELVYVALHKPRNVLSAVEGEAGDSRKTVRDLIPLPGHLYPVGRLDFDSEGLVLMTNDGELANRLTHPRFGHEKVYRVLVARHPDPEQIQVWRRGVVLEDGYKTQPVNLSVESSAGKGSWLRIVMKEGRKRQIREVGAKIGLPVVRIVRVSIGTLALGSLKSGDWRYLTEEEIKFLKQERFNRADNKPTGVRSMAKTPRKFIKGKTNENPSSEKPLGYVSRKDFSKKEKPVKEKPSRSRKALDLSEERPTFEQYASTEPKYAPRKPRRTTGGQPYLKNTSNENSSGDFQPDERRKPPVKSRRPVGGKPAYGKSKPNRPAGGKPTSTRRPSRNGGDRSNKKTSR